MDGKALLVSNVKKLEDALVVSTQHGTAQQRTAHLAQRSSASSSTILQFRVGCNAAAACGRRCCDKCLLLMTDLCVLVLTGD